VETVCDDDDEDEEDHCTESDCYASCEEEEEEEAAEVEDPEDPSYVPVPKAHWEGIAPNIKFPKPRKKKARRNCKGRRVGKPKRDKLGNKAKGGQDEPENDSQDAPPHAQCPTMGIPMLKRHLLVTVEELNKMAEEADSPVVCVETFVDEKRRVVVGPDGDKFKAEGYENSEGLQRVEFLFAVCGEEFCYAFKDANMKPHGAGVESKLRVMFDHLQAVDTKCEPREKKKHRTDFGITYNTNGEVISAGTNNEAGLGLIEKGHPLWDTYFGNIRLDVEKIVKYFLDTKDKKEKDKLRGTYACHIGFADHAYESHLDTQERVAGVVGGMPTLLNPVKDRVIYESIGHVLDAMQQFVDDHFRSSNGGGLMNDVLHDELFARRMREACRAAKARWDAATVAMQRVGTITKDKKTGADKFKWNMQFTWRHKDGENSTDDGWNYTAVYSVLVKVGMEVYRITIIAYTRASVQDWLFKENEYRRPISDIISKYKAIWNGGITYEEFKLDHDMSKWKVLENVTGDAARLLPQVEETAQGGQVIPLDVVGGHVPHAVQWGEDPTPRPMRWKNAFPLEQENDAEDSCDDPQPQQEQNPGIQSGKRNKYLDPLERRNASELNFKFVNVREFICRYGFESAFAWAINLLTDTYPELNVEMKKLEIVYTALMSPSIINFVGVLLKWVFERPPVQSWSDTNLLQLFCEYCRMYGLKERGGRLPRYVCLGGDVNWPTLKLSEEDFRGEMDKMRQGLLDLKKGTMGEKVFHPDCEGMGEMYGYSFAPICVFVGLASTDEAYNKAMGAKYNPDSKYGEELCRKLREEYSCDKGWTEENLPWMQVFTSVATLFGNDRVRDSENGICTSNRVKETQDVFPYLMDMYTIRATGPAMKAFGSDNWGQNFRLERRNQTTLRRLRIGRGEPPEERMNVLFSQEEI
jgi:hypothetical protein